MPASLVAEGCCDDEEAAARKETDDGWEFHEGQACNAYGVTTGYHTESLYYCITIDDHPLFIISGTSETKDFRPPECAARLPLDLDNFFISRMFYGIKAENILILFDTHFIIFRKPVIEENTIAFTEKKYNNQDHGHSLVVDDTCGALLKTVNINRKDTNGDYVK